MNCLHLPPGQHNCLDTPLSILHCHAGLALTAESRLSIKLFVQVTVLPQPIAQAPLPHSLSATHAHLSKVNNAASSQLDSGGCYESTTAIQPTTACSAVPLRTHQHQAASDSAAQQLDWPLLVRSWTLSNRLAA